MLIVAGVFEVEPDRREEYLASRAETMRISRTEPGCLEYVFSADPIVAGRVVLFERWQDKQSLAAHLTAIRAKPAAAGAVPVIRSETAQYEIDVIGPVGS
jgi:quinol monooxygenase YgiN